MIRTIAVVLTALALLIYPALAANEGFNTLILGLPAASTPLTGNETVPLVQGGTSKSITPQIILQMMTGDCTAIGVVVTCTKINGQTLGPLATVPSVTGDCSQSGGAFTCTKTNGVFFGSLSTFTGTVASGDVWTGNGGTTPTDSGVLLSSLMSIGGAPPKTFNASYFYVDAAPYNAAGNGTTDDQGPINTALTACGAAGGGMVVLGPHRYLVSAANLSVPQGCILYCPNPLVGQTTNINYSTSTYTLIINSARTISMGGATGLYGCNVISQAVATSTAWTDFPNLTTRDLVNLGAAYTGTGVSWSQADVTFRDLFVGGFATGMSGTTRTARTRMDHVNLDDTACLYIDNSHDLSRLSHVECWPFITTNYANTAPTFAISGVANNGSGLYRVTLSAATAVPVTGDTVWISYGFTGPQSIQGNRWTITQIDTTHIDLQGSAGTGSVTPTGNTTVNSPVVCSVSSMANIGPGETISGTGIGGGTTVAWVSPNGSCLGLSQNASSTQTGTTLTITDTAYASGGTVLYGTNFRTGIGMEFQSSEGIESNDLFTFGHLTGFHLGTGMLWFACTNCWNDGGQVDNTFRSVLIDGTAKGTSWLGGRLNAMAVHVNSTTTGENHIFSAVTMDALVGANPVPIFEQDQGAATLSADVSNNGNGFYFLRNAATSLMAIGNQFAGQWQFEAGTAIQKLTAIANAMTANTFQGNVNLASNQITLGTIGATCGQNATNGVTCGTYIGGQFADLSFNQITMTAAGSNSPTGNQHSTLYHAAGTISSYTINLAGINQVGQEYNMYFDQAVTTLTMGGATSVGMPGSAAINTWYKCMANPAKTTWVCSQG